MATPWFELGSPQQDIPAVFDWDEQHERPIVRLRPGPMMITQELIDLTNDGLREEETNPWDDES